MSVESWTLDGLVEAYREHQRRTRGLREGTLDGYERLVRAFVRSALGEDPIDPSRLCSGDVVGFVVAMQARFSPCSDEGGSHGVAVVLSLPAVRGAM